MFLTRFWSFKDTWFFKKYSKFTFEHDLSVCDRKRISFFDKNKAIDFCNIFQKALRSLKSIFLDKKWQFKSLDDFFWYKLMSGTQKYHLEAIWGAIFRLRRPIGDLSQFLAFFGPRGPKPKNRISETGPNI